MKYRKNKLFIKLIFPFIIIIIFNLIINVFFVQYFFSVNDVNTVNTEITQIRIFLIRFFVIIFLIESIVVTFIYSFFIRKYIMRPMNKLITAMNKVIENTNFSYQINIDSYDEFGELQQHFNNMINNLNKKNIEINNIREKNSQLEKFQILSNLSSGLAHEINNPLNNISLSAEVLKKYNRDSDNKQKQVITKIETEINKIKNIVNSFNNFSKLSVENKENISSVKFVNEICELTDYEKQNKQVKFIINNKLKNQKFKIVKEPVKFVLINIIKNAIDSVEYKTGVIEFNLYKTDKNYVFEILDNGKGLPENFDKIFEPFVSYKHNGTGLGLAISKKLLQIVNGTIECKNREIQGAEFAVKIPV